MSTQAPLRVLILEDSAADAELIQRALRAGGIAATSLIVGDEPAFRTALAEFAPAVILADYALPGFTGTAAVAIAREWDPSVPCILVSGTLGEELAVTALHSGATDYVVKQRLELLAPAVRRALDESAERRERQRLTAELQHFHEITTETFEQMPLGFVALDHEQRVTYANPAALALVGVSLAEVIGRRSRDLFPQVIGTRFQTREAQTSAGVTVDYEEYFAPRDLWVDVLACPSSVGVAVFLRDISDRKRAEDAVRGSEARMRGSLDAMLDAFVICSSVRDDQGSIVGFRVDFANGAAGAFMGAAPETLIGALLPDLMPNLRGTRFSDACRRVIDTGESWTEDAVESAIPEPGGMRGVIDIQIIKYADGFFVVWRDVSERERTRLERERLAAVVEQTLDGVLITDARGIVAYANPAFLAANRLALDELVGRPAAAIVVEMFGLDAFAGLKRAGHAAKPWLQEIEQESADDTTRHLEVSMTPVRDASGAVTSHVLVTRNVTELREAEAELVLEARVRVALAETLHNIPDEASLEQAAQAICEKLVTLPFVDVASVDAFLGPSDVQVIGHSAPLGHPVSAGDHLPPARAATVQARAAVGPWAEYLEPNPADGGWTAAAMAAGLKAMAFGPIVRGDHVGGILLIGTYDERFARTLVEKMPGLVSSSAASSALLAERLHVRRREAELRKAFASVLAARAFHPVFQPIIDLESREVVGYEALTRFDSGRRPDLCFADAWSVGLGADLEIATIEAAVAASKGLPQGRWLDLNLSPRLLEDPERLKPLLRPAGRPIVLEITEHEPIEDYGAVREAIRALGQDIRLAVDDAGAGVANFGHIIELQPDFVKLDLSLVRRVNGNLGRQAMVVGMRHFSRTAGCRLVAEGIETEPEAQTLTGLGVEFGQGYLFGHPEPVEVWAAARTAGRDERPARLRLPTAPAGRADDRHVRGVPARVPRSAQGLRAAVVEVTLVGDTGLEPVTSRM